MGKVYVFCRFWPGFTPQFPFDRFNDLADDQIESELRSVVERDGPSDEAIAEWLEAKRLRALRGSPEPVKPGPVPEKEEPTALLRAWLEKRTQPNIKPNPPKKGTAGIPMLVYKLRWMGWLYGPIVLNWSQFNRRILLVVRTQEMANELVNALAKRYEMDTDCPRFSSVPAEAVPGQELLFDQDADRLLAAARNPAEKGPLVEVARCAFDLRNRLLARGDAGDALAKPDVPSAIVIGGDMPAQPIQGAPSDWPVILTLQEFGRRFIDTPLSLADTARSAGWNEEMQRTLMARFIRKLRTYVKHLSRKHRIEPAEQCDDPFEEFGLIRLWYAHAREQSFEVGNQTKSNGGDAIPPAQPENPLYFPLNKAGALLNTLRLIAELPPLPRPKEPTLGNGKSYTYVHDAQTGCGIVKVIADEGWEIRNPDWTNATTDPDTALWTVTEFHKPFVGLVQKIVALKAKTDAAGLNGWTTRCIALCAQMASMLSGIGLRSKQETVDDWRFAMALRERTPEAERPPALTLEEHASGRRRLFQIILCEAARTPHQLESFAAGVEQLRQFGNELDVVLRHPVLHPAGVADSATLQMADDTKATKGKLEKDLSKHNRRRRSIKRGKKKAGNGALKADHSDDYTSVNWFGTDYLFDIGNQAKAIALLWTEYTKGGFGLHEKTIGEKIDAANENFRMAFVFRGHPALGAMIGRTGKRGQYKLSPPTVAGRKPKKKQ